MAEHKKQQKHGNLPLEMQVEILSRLPPKQLILFSCVCKSWCAIIKSKSFRKLHQIRLRRKYSHTSSEILMISVIDGASYTYDFDSNVVEKKATTIFRQPKPIFSWSDPGFSIISCDGLLLLRYSSKDYPGLCLINPLTRASRHIPVSDTRNWNFGFGYDHIGDDYKILRLPINHWPSNYIQEGKDAEIYSVNNKSWKKVQVSLSETYTGKIYVRDKIVPVENKLHWLSSTDPYRDTEVISSINLETEKYEEIPMCDEILTLGGSREVTSLRGCLHVVNIIRLLKADDKVDIWRLDDECDGRTTWTLLVHCLVSDLKSKFVREVVDCTQPWPCAYTHDGQHVLLDMGGSNHKEYAHVNLKSGEIRKVNIYSFLSNDDPCRRDIRCTSLVLPWTPSLVSPGGYDDTTTTTTTTPVIV